MELMTIGYEGLKPEEFIRLLEIGEVQTVVDVRQLPLSRKPGFSKVALASSVNQRGMKYIHMRELGCPKNIRHDYHIDRDWDRYTVRYKSYLEAQLESVLQLADLAMNERCCLLCFEADPNFCHRLYVAERVASLPDRHFDVRHITARDLARTDFLMQSAA